MNIFMMASNYWRTYTPEILLGIGSASIVGGTIFSIKGGMRASKCIEEYKVRMQLIDDTRELDKDGKLEESTPYTEEDAKYDTRFATKELLIGVGTAIAPGALMIAAGLCCGAAALGIANQRTVVMAGLANSALTLLDEKSKSFEEYRARVREEYGEEADLRFLTKGKLVDVTEEVVGEDGKKHKVKRKEIVPIDEGGFNVADCYQFTFGPTIGNADKYGDEVSLQKNYNWCQNAGVTDLFIHQAEKWADLQLKVNGYITLAQVLKALGMPEPDYSFVVGWTMNGSDGDRTVSFRRKQLPGGVFLLDFNCDGKIYGKICREITLKALENQSVLFKM